jgi:hypothetical protein
MPRRKPAPLPPDTGIPSKIAFNIVYDLPEKQTTVEGTIEVTDGSASLPMCLNHIWPDITTKVPGLHLATTITLTATRLA